MRHVLRAMFASGGVPEVGTDSLGSGISDIRTPQFGEDGKRVHYFRQSSMKTVDLCLRQAQLQMRGELDRWETDAACAGTAAHAAIEVCLIEKRDSGVALGLKAATIVAQAEFDELIALPNFRWIKRNEVQSRRFIANCVRAWHEQVLPRLVPMHMELDFGPLLLHEDDQRRIYLKGTIDYVDAVQGLLDWKTSGRPYEAWEKERWDLQASAYTWAAHQLGVVTDAPFYGFEFVVMVDHRADEVKIQRVPVVRHTGDWGWLAQRCVGVAELIEAEVPTWPMNDNHALCSPKWCPAWDQCKGRFYADGWPRPTKPRV